ncbi:hypothetical protein [Belnapia moabensis]|uniref:hypothetical protein n=1 Tax=Belnapia moabensis TaxID=365533 RepID=UPI0005BC1F35|nr:hypothetical protein [Belnapia moabensis]
MGGFFLLHKRDPVALDTASRTMDGHFRAAGFPPATVREGVGYRLFHYPKILGGPTQHAVGPDGRFLACVGSLLYAGETGTAALQRLLACPDPAAELPRCQGQFALLAGDTRSVRILRDRSAALEVFHDEVRGAFSTSFLALARALPQRLARRQEAYEYVFHGTTLGDDTVLEGIRRLGLGAEAMVAEEVRIARTSRRLLPPEAAGTAEELAHDGVEQLTTNLLGWCGAFGGRITLALSGGYDTRLLLALCRRIGVQPRLFVYGPESSADVRIAKAIARTEGMEIDHFDKGTWCAEALEEPAARLARTYHEVDGLMYYGILDSGAEALARRRRHEGGALNLHGGAGEVFRNFFGLPERPVTAVSLARVFYRVDSTICTAGFSEAEYAARIAGKIGEAWDEGARPASRRAAEATYPYFRCRAWFGKDLSVNAAFGHGVLPFYDPAIVDFALSLPLRHKEFGNFEARMIRLADPAIAVHRSAYGFDFTRDTPFPNAFRSWVLQRRPSWLRQRGSRGRLSRGTPGPAPWQNGAGADPLRHGLDLVRRILRPDVVNDPTAQARIHNLAYLLGDLGVEGWR